MATRRGVPATAARPAAAGVVVSVAGEAADEIICYNQEGYENREMDSFELCVGTGFDGAAIPARG